MEVLFENSVGKLRKIAEVSDREDAYKEIEKFCGDRDYTIPYIRCWKKNDTTIVDVGSYTEFFHLVG